MAYKTQTVTQTNVGTSTDLKIIRKPENFKCLIHAVVTSGSPTFTLEYSINSVDYITLNGLSGQTASIDTTLVFPIDAIRTTITGGTGTVKLIILHNDGDGNS